MGDTLHHHVIETERCGSLNVYVQGDIEQARRGEKTGHPCFFTVHDIGKNHNSWLNFVFHPSMNNVRERSVFIHVDLLGQENDAEDLASDTRYPSMQMIGEDLINILDTLRVKTVIGLGDGAGANIMARFMAIHHKRCFGVILVNPTGTQAKFMEQFKDRLRSRFTSMASTTENYLVLHRFGYKLEDIDNDEELAKALDEYKDRISESKVNHKNSKFFVDAFMQRDDITARLPKINEDMMLIFGARSSYATNVEQMFTACNKTKTSLLKIDEVGDVVEEAPSKLANSLLLFCKGMGWLTTLTAPGVERQRSASQSSTGSGSGSAGGAGRMGRRMSMEEYDKPNIRRLSLTGAAAE